MPNAFSRIFSLKLFATDKATSASSKAVLISFTVSFMSDSDKRPLVLRALKVLFKRSESCWNMIASVVKNLIQMKSAPHIQK